MGTPTWISTVAENHKEWIKIATVYGAGDMAEDLVQDAYIKLIKYDCEHKAIKNGKPNKNFIFFVVKNTVLNYHNSKKHFTDSADLKKINVDYTSGVGHHDLRNELENFPAEELDDREEAWNIICEKVDEITDTWHWKHKKIFDDYRFTEDSIRGVGRKYDISFVTIFNTIKECKNHIKYELKEDYEDFQNGDFEKI